MTAKQTHRIKTKKKKEKYYWYLSIRFSNWKTIEEKSKRNIKNNKLLIFKNCCSIVHVCVSVRYSINNNINLSRNIQIVWKIFRFSCKQNIWELISYFTCMFSCMFVHTNTLLLEILSVYFLFYNKVERSRFKDSFLNNNRQPVTLTHTNFQI